MKRTLHISKSKKIQNIFLISAASLLLTAGWLAASNTVRPTIAKEMFEHAAQTSQPDPSRLANEYGKLPMSFEANQGQSDKRVRFLSRGDGYALFLTPTEAVLSLRVPGNDRRRRQTKHTVEREQKTAIRTTALRMRLLGSNRAPIATGLEPLPGKTNYFVGSDPKKWRTDVPNYGKVRFADVYPGVDVVYYGNQRQLEYDFVVAPGADPSVIRLGFKGSERLEIDAQGELVLHTRSGEVRWRKPVIYQDFDGTRQTVDGRYVLKGKKAVAFDVGSFDPRYPLVIDPVLTYSTYLGGSVLDVGQAIAVDLSGNAYVTGYTQSANFPVLNPVAGHNVLLGTQDAFVTKLNATGTALVYSTYLGGSGSDQGTGIGTDSIGNAYVTGFTDSSNYPITIGLRPWGGGQDAFVTKLNSAGNVLTYSTYLGGSSDDQALGIAVDTLFNVDVTGRTASTNFPTTTGAFRTTYVGGSSDAFVTRLASNGAVANSTFLGGTNSENMFSSFAAIAIDSSFNAYITGTTFSTDFPTLNPLQPALTGFADVFVTKLNVNLSTLVYSTYLGGTGFDSGYSIAVDLAGGAYITGQTNSADFPGTSVSTIQPTYGGGEDAFVTKLNAAGSALVYSTYLGGTGAENGRGIAFDSSGNAYVTGGTLSADFPLANPIPPGTFGGGFGDAFVTKLNATGSALEYSTFLGGDSNDGGAGIVVRSTDAYVTGGTGFPTVTAFPTTPGAYRTLPAGGNDGFITKIGSTTPTPTPINSTTTTAIHNGAHQTVTTVDVGTTVHDFVSVSGGGSTPTGNVNIDWFLNGSCAGTPAANSGNLALIGGQVDATGFAFTVNSAGFRGFRAHYLGDSNYPPSDGPCEPLRVVDANIQLTPPTGTNDVGTTDTLICHINVNDGNGSTNAPSGTNCTGTIVSGPGSFVGSNQCSTVGTTGDCQLQITSSATGQTTIKASTDVTVAGLIIHRETGDSHAGDGPHATRQWIATSSTATVIHNAAHQAVSTVEIGTTVHDFVTVTGSGGTPTGNVNIDWFLNGSCTGLPAVNSSSIGPLAGGQFDATGFAFTVNSPGFRGFKAHYEGDANFPASDGPCESLTVVDANIQLTPQTGTRRVGTTDLLTCHINVNDGNGFANAPAGTPCSGFITSGPSSTILGSACLTIGTTGECQIPVTSSVTGPTTIRGSTDVVINGLTVHRETADGHAGDGQDATRLWINAAIVIAPNATNEVGQNHTYTATLLFDTGSGLVPTGAGQPITMTLTPANGANPIPAGPFNVSTNAAGQITATFTSASPGTVAGHASWTGSVSGSPPFTIETDGVAPNSADGAVTFVDAYIEIGPPTATTTVNTIHTYSARVFVNNGSGATYTDAPDGTQVTFTLLPGSVGSFTAGDTCVTSGGICTINTTSAVVGNDGMQASTTVAVGGVSITRATGQSAPGHANSSNAFNRWVTATSPVSQITLPTVTCAEFAAGTASDLNAVSYTVKTRSGLSTIQEVDPNVFRYWVRVTATAGTNSRTVQQSILSGNFNDGLFTFSSGSNVFDANCNAVSATFAAGPFPTSTADTFIARWISSSAGTYYISIKLAAKALKGLTAPTPSTVNYNFFTQGESGSSRNLDLIRSGPRPFSFVGLELLETSVSYDVFDSKEKGH